MAEKKLTDVDVSSSYDSVIVNVNGNVRQVSKSIIEEPINDINIEINNLKTEMESLKVSDENIKELLINVEDYGLVNDGVTDNLEAFNSLIMNNPNKTLIFSGGVFCFSGKLIFPKAYIILDNTELRCTSDSVIDRFIEVEGEMTDPEYPTSDMFIKGNGIVNANLKAECAIGISIQKMMLISGIKIKNFLTVGVNQKYDDRGLSYEFILENLLIENQTMRDGTIGIYGMSDSTYKDITVLNCKTGVYVMGGGSLYKNIHVWNYDWEHNNTVSKFENTTCFYVTGSNNRFDNCYLDTAQYGYVFTNDCESLITNTFWYINGETYPYESLTPVVFKAEDGITPKLRVISSLGERLYGTKIVQGDFSKSSFIGINGSWTNREYIEANNLWMKEHLKLLSELECGGEGIGNMGSFSFQFNDYGRRIYGCQQSRGDDGSPVLFISEWHPSLNKDVPVIVTNIATPTENSDAVNKEYVDECISRLRAELSQ